MVENITGRSFYAGQREIFPSLSLFLLCGKEVVDHHYDKTRCSERSEQMSCIEKRASVVSCRTQPHIIQPKHEKGCNEHHGRDDDFLCSHKL